MFSSPTVTGIYRQFTPPSWLLNAAMILKAEDGKSPRKTEPPPLQLEQVPQICLG